MLTHDAEGLSFCFAEDPSEIQELARQVRRFSVAEFSVSSPDQIEFKRSGFDSMAKLGLTGMSVQEKCGGTDIGALGIACALYEISQVQLGPAIYISVHAMVAGLVNRFMRHPEHHALLEKLADGRALGAFCLTEAQAGSDAAALSTKATREGIDYVLSGEKIYITSAGVADVYLVFARTAEHPTKGISAFLVTRDTAGISFGPHETKMGCEGSPIGSIRFDACRIPESARLGAEGEGYKIALAGLQGGRINIAAAACGLAATSIRIATRHLQQRKQFGSALRDFQGLQFMLADMYTRYRASVLLTRDAAKRLLARQADSLSASTAKCFATDSAMAITTDGVQLLGGAGYLWDYGAERLMRDAKMLQIVEGTNQIQRMLIARALLD